MIAKFWLKVFIIRIVKNVMRFIAILVEVIQFGLGLVCQRAEGRGERSTTEYPAFVGMGSSPACLMTIKYFIIRRTAAQYEKP